MLPVCPAAEFWSRWKIIFAYAHIIHRMYRNYCLPNLKRLRKFFWSNYNKCNIPMNPHVRRLVGWSVGWSVWHYFLEKTGKLHIHAPIGVLAVAAVNSHNRKLYVHTFCFLCSWFEIFVFICLYILGIIKLLVLPSGQCIRNKKLHAFVTDVGCEGVSHFNQSFWEIRK